MSCRERLLGLALGAALLLACAPSAAPAPTAPAPAPVAPTAAPGAQSAAQAPGAAPAAPSSTAAPVAQASARPAAPAPLDPPVAVKAGMIGSSSDSGVYIAIERGYFQEEGLAVELEPITSATAAIAALGTGALDVAGGGLTAGLFNALRRNVPIRLVADKGSLLPGFGYESLLVRRDLLDSGQFADYRDLRGLKVAVNSVPSVDIVLLARALERAGLTLDDTEVVEIAFPEQLAAYGNRAIDASLLIEPFTARVVENNLAGSFVSFDQLAPNEQIAALLFGARLVEGNPEAGRRFMVGYLRGIRDYNDAFAHNRGKDEIINVLTKHTTIKEPALWQRITPPGLNPDGAVSRASIANAQDFFAARGLVAEKTDLDGVIDDSFVQYALGRLGPYQR